MARIVIDPVTRIEGHLRIEVEVDAHTVTDAWSSGTMFRGIELVLRGRDPREAWIWPSASAVFARPFMLWLRCVR